MAHYRILSLDGGGPWSLLQARALAEIFGPDVKGQTLLSRFDLVASNSGGAVVVAGLLADMTPGEIERNCFTDPDRLAAIFKESVPSGHALAVLLRELGMSVYRYSTEAKYQALRDVLGRAIADTPVPGLPALFAAGRRPHFLFTAFDYDRLREMHFRSDLASPAASATTLPPLTLAQAVHASSNAPLLYFDAPATYGENVRRNRFWDGAVGGYNNPVLLAVAEAVAYGIPREDIEVLSLGSGTVMLPLDCEFPQADAELVRKTGDFTVVGDLTKIAGALLDDPPDAASLHAYTLLGRKLPGRKDGAVQPMEPDRFVRLNPLIRPHWDGGQWRPPASFQGADWTAIRDLELICVKPEEIALLKRLADAWITADPADVPNQPLRFGWPHFATELGHATCDRAVAAAQRLMGEGPAAA